MKINKKFKQAGLTFCYTLLSSAILSVSSQAYANQPELMDVAQTPLNLSEGVPPNMILSLDESGSMSWAFVPDAAHQVAKDKFGNGSTVNYASRRIRAVNANPMAYDPSIIYEIPPAFNKDGSEITLSTTFTSAPLNGFWLPAERNNQTGRGKQDLRTNYRLAREHRLGTNNDGGTLNWANHPADFDCEVNITTNNQSKDCVKTSNGATSGAEQIRFTIKRTGASSCTADLHMPNGTLQSVGCSRRTTNYFRVNLVATGVPAYYYEFDKTLPGCASKTAYDKDAGGENCHRLRFVTETSAYLPDGTRLKHRDGSLVDGRENFAIWYSFYRSRALATLSAASIAFYDLSSDVRFTWQNLATCTNFTSTTSGSGSCGDNRLKPYTGKHRGEFYDWLRRIYFNTGTPLLATMYRAGEYLKTDAPWQRYPHGIGGTNTPENTYACRPSYHVLMTDGMWNTARNIGTSRSDESSFTTPGGDIYGGKEYTQQKPYYGVTKSTLADYAMHYWATDLRPDMENKLTPYMPFKSGDEDKDYWDPRNNPAEWQHMSNFIMGLGLTNALNNSSVPWADATHAGQGYKNLSDGSAVWPPPSSGSQNNVYDLWHAAINSRGDFYSVDSPQAMVQAFKDILTRIADRKSTAAMPGISATMESDETPDGGDRLATYFYQTSYDSADWSGDVQEIKRYRTYDPNSRAFTDVVVTGNKASENLPQHGARKIYMANQAGDALVEFTTANATTSLKNYLKVNPETGTVDDRWEDRINYIRGDRSKEGDGNTQFRRRQSLLADFFASQPVVVGGARYLQDFSNKLEGNTAYTNFMAAAKSRPKFLYVGGNGGMLHAFDTATMQEKFAFVPTAVMENLNKLTGKNYSQSHQFFVDGTPVIADVYDKQNARWRTILVGTLRAGGKGMFALDITDPNGIKLLWELHDGNFPGSVNDNPTTVGVGYSFAKPTVARLHDGNWAVVTGNGYKANGSANGAAALFVINALTGEMIKTLEVQSATKADNGLSTPTLADLDGDGVADYAYAGDLHGNLWRFDLFGSTASAAVTGSNPVNHGSYGAKNDTENFKVSFGGKPLFVARSAQGNIQPITAAPTLVRHPSRVGYLITFGTGKYFQYGDKTGDENNFQSVYGVWDMHTKAEDTSGITAPLNRDNLFEQKIQSIAGGKGVGETTNKERDVRGLSDDPVEWFQGSDKNTAKHRGWFFDLKLLGLDGEMVIEKMQLLGDTLFMQTLVPNEDPCTSGASNWLYAINAATGGKTEHHAFDTRGPDGKIVSAIKFGTEGGVSISQDEERFNANASDDQEPLTPDPSTLGRQTWRMIHDA